MIIVTRHAGAVEWLRRRGMTGQVIAQVNSPEEIRGQVVVGTLPLHLCAVCARVISVDLPGLRPEQRGKDLSPEEMEEAGANLRTYVVHEIWDRTI